MIRIAHIIIRATFLLLLSKTPLCYGESIEIDLANDTEIELGDNMGFEQEFTENPSINDQQSGYLQGVFNDFTFKLSHQIYAQVNDQKELSARGERSQQEVENNRFNLLIKYQNPFAPGWLIQGSSHIKLFLPGDYEYGEHNDPNLAEFTVSDFIEFRFNEIFIQKSFSDQSFKLGRQTVVWGEVQSNSVLDVVNIREFRDLSVIEIEDARLNQWMLLWEYYGENKRLSTFFNFYPEFNPQPRTGSPLYRELPFSLNEPDRNKFFYEVGSQFKWSVGASDISLMAAYLYENQLRFKPPDGLSGEANAITNDYWMVGASINRAIGKLLLKLDVAYNHGVLADTRLKTQSLSTNIKNQIGASLGFEYAINHDQYISASVAAQYYVDQSSGLAEGEQLINADIFDRWRLLYSHKFLNDNLNFSTLLIGSLEDKNILASMTLDYALDDNWSVTGQLISTWASADSSTPVLDEGIRLGLTITYSF